MRWRLVGARGALSLASFMGCSSGPVAEALHPGPVVTPIPSVTASVPVGHSACEIAALLVDKAEALRKEGRLARADRALADALVRCPDKAADIAARKKSLEAERAPGPGDTASALLDRLEKLGKDGDAAARRRASERWLSALEQERGATTKLSVPNTTYPVWFEWSPDGSLGAVLHPGELSLYDSDLRKELERYAVDFDMSKLVWFHKRRAVLVVNEATGAYSIVDLEKKRVGPISEAASVQTGSLQITDDDRYLIVAEGPSVTLVDLEQARKVGALSTASEVNGISVSPSGSKLAVTLEGGKVQIHDFPGLKLALEFSPFADASRPYFQSDSRLLLTASATASVFDVANGKPVGKPLVNNDCSPMILGLKNEKLVWACYAYLEAEGAPGGKRVGLYTPGTQAHLYTSFDSMSASPDGSRLWYSLWGEQYIVDTKTGKLVTGVSVPSWTGVHFRADNKRIAAVQAGGSALWTSDLHKDERIAVGSSGPGYACTRLLSPASATVMFADVDAVDGDLGGKARLTLRAPGVDAKASAVFETDSCAIDFSDDAARAGVMYEGKFQVVSLPQATSVASFELAQYRVERAFLSASGKFVAVVGPSGIRIVEVATGKPVAVWSMPCKKSDAVSFSPDGARVLVAHDKGAALYEVGREAPRSFAPNKGPMGFAGDDLVISAQSGEIVIHDLRAETSRATSGPADPKRLFPSRDGAWVVVIADKSVALVDTASGKTDTLFPHGTADAVTATFLTGDRVLALHDEGQSSVQFFRIPSRTKLGTLSRQGGKGAVYVSETGNIEAFGEARDEVKCFLPPEAMPLSKCEDRHVEEGLLARTLAGRGCTSEDVGHMCD